MIVDPTHRRIRLGKGEKIVLSTATIGPMIACGIWLWHLSDRVLVMENLVIRQTAIIEKLDGGREGTAADRATAAQRFVDLERRLEGIDRNLESMARRDRER